MIASKLTGSRKSLPKGARMVLDSLVEAKEMLSAKELAFRLKLKNPVSAPGLTTVYRSLELLSRLGIIQEVRLNSEEKRYELLNPGEHNHHLVCKTCGQSTKIKCCLLGATSESPSFEKELLNEYGFKVSSHVLEVFGTCKLCRERTENKEQTENYDAITLQGANDESCISR